MHILECLTSSVPLNYEKAFSVKRTKATARSLAVRCNSPSGLLADVLLLLRRYDREHHHHHNFAAVHVRLHRCAVVQRTTLLLHGRVQVYSGGVQVRPTNHRLSPMLRLRPLVQTSVTLFG